jgi:hypothetical protein
MGNKSIKRLPPLPPQLADKLGQRLATFSFEYKGVHGVGPSWKEARKVIGPVDKHTGNQILIQLRLRGWIKLPREEHSIRPGRLWFAARKPQPPAQPPPKRPPRPVREPVQRRITKWQAHRERLANGTLQPRVDHTGDPGWHWDGHRWRRVTGAQ